LSTLGTLFFGGLCASTFGLGCWQSVRYFEKVDQMQARDEELKAPPVPLKRFTAAADTADSNTNGSDATKDNNQQQQQQRRQQHEPPSFRRVITRGTFDHAREMLVGPRGPPPGALSSTGPSSGRSSGGMSSSPQGYYVVTPLRVASGDGADSGGNNNNTILVNRGWVPLSYVKQNAGTWSQPRGVVQVVGVETLTEQPKFLSPVHDARTPNQLLWFDRAALEERTGTGTGTAAAPGHHPLLLTETASGTDGTAACAAAHGQDPDPVVPVPVVPAPTFPVRPTAETVGEFKVTPTTHAGYAVTWFGLSGAGVVMTRKLLTRGR
jgi:surfeit locus 1 family protein